MNSVATFSNIAATKILAVGPLSFDGGTLLFPLAYIFGDVLTEVYGYRQSRRVIWTGFFWLVMTALVLSIVDWLPPAAEWTSQDAFHTILGQTPRIVVAGLVASSEHPMVIRDLMTVHPVHIFASATMRQATELISVAEVSDLMVVGEDRTFIGVLSEGDVIRAVLPNFEEILSAGGSLSDAFQFFMHKGRELAQRPIAPLIITDAITMQPTDHAATAAVIMAEKQIRRLPVVDNGKLVGTVSRADICRAVVYGW